MTAYDDAAELVCIGLHANAPVFTVQPADYCGPDPVQLTATCAGGTITAWQYRAITDSTWLPVVHAPGGGFGPLAYTVDTLVRAVCTGADGTVTYSTPAELLPECEL